MGRRPISKEEKKDPSEYPQFTFRISKSKKSELSDLIESIQVVRNKKRIEGDPFTNKNDVIIEALELGLKAIKKRE